MFGTWDFSVGTNRLNSRCLKIHECLSNVFWCANENLFLEFQLYKTICIHTKLSSMASLALL